VPDEVHLQDALPAARRKLEQVVQRREYPDIQASLEQLREAINQLPAEGTAEQLASATQSVTALYRTSMAQANAAPQKYQQPVFQCYADYQRCAAKQTATAGKALCIALFVLSLADNLLELSIKP
jgi:hypothetical protein